MTELGLSKKLRGTKLKNLVSEENKPDLEVCKKSLEEFLDFVKIRVRKESQYYYLEREKGKSTFNLNQDSDDKYQFLPSWLQKNK